MVIVYGYAHMGKRDKVSEWMMCPHCEQGVTMTSYSAREWFSLYWIPLIPLWSARVVLKCPQCGKYYRFGLDGKNLAEAIASGREGIREQVAAGADVVTDVATMAHMGDFEGAAEAIGALRAAGHHVMAWAAEGRLRQLQGLCEEAHESFLRAVKADGTHPAGHYWFGRFLLDNSRDKEAIQQFQRLPVGAKYPYEGMLNIMAGQRRSQGNWTGAMVLLEEMRRLDPALMENLGFVKFLEQVQEEVGRSVGEDNPYAMH